MKIIKEKKRKKERHSFDNAANGMHEICDPLFTV